MSGWGVNRRTAPSQSVESGHEGRVVLEAAQIQGWPEDEVGKEKRGEEARLDEEKLKIQFKAVSQGAFRKF